MTAERAVATAAEVDRVVIAVHRSIGDDARFRTAAAAQAIGLDSIAYWADLAPFMLAGQLTDELVRTRFRYTYEPAASAIAALRANALVNGIGRPSVDLRGVIEMIESVRLATAARLWASSSHLAALSSEGAVMLRAARGPLVEPYRSLTEPDDNVGRLWHRLIGLRYLRADAHAAAWEAAGFTASEILDLTEAWRSGLVESPQHSLVARGAVSASGEITQMGAAVRERVEDETNARSEHAYLAVGSERWAGWMAAMAELPSALGTADKHDVPPED